MLRGQFADCRCVGSPRARRLCRTEPCAQSGVGISSPNPALLLPSLCAVVPPRRCGWCGGSCCGAPARKPNKISAVAVLRLDGVRGDADGVASLQHRVPRTRPLFDMGTCGAALRLPNTLSAHRITEELVDSKVLLEGAYSADQRSAVRWIGDRSSHSWSDGASLTVVAAPVARGLGGYLGGCRVAGLGRVVVVLSIKRPKRAHTRGRI